MEAVVSELNLFEPFMNQTAVTACIVQQFAPVVTIIQAAPIDFQVECSGKNYIILKKSNSEMRVNMTTPTAGDIEATATVRSVNLPVHSLFQSLTMKIADKVVPERINLNPYRELFETPLNYEADVMNIRLKCEGYQEDPALNDTNPAAGRANTGIKARDAKFNNSKVVRLIGRLHSDLWHQEKRIPPGIKLDVQLVPAHQDGRSARSGSAGTL